jgi:NAD(P)-dependent dehydrogenase (short-subunit alcohol dehydrogenase family)
MEFSKRTIVVTGGARGIGEASVRAFLREGGRVAILDMDDAGQHLADELGENVSFHLCNVGVSEEVKAVMGEIVDRHGAVHVLVNNAGIQRYGTVENTSEEEWDEVMNVNLKSVFLCTKYLMPALKREGGVVVNVASVQSFVTQASVAAYTTSKTALLGLTRSIAVDFAPEIRAVAVCPGTVDTPMLQWAAQQSPDPEEIYRECRAIHPLARIATPEEVADLIVFLASPRASFITGQAYRIDGGLGLSIGGSVRK